MSWMFLRVLLAALAVPALAQAQSGVPSCPDCILGLYDQPAMVTNYGTIAPNTIKEIYLGMQFGAGESSLAGIEFSIAGIRQVEDGVLLLGWEGVSTPLPAISLGTIPAPADTAATSAQTGGIDIAWASCVVGNQALLKITLLSMAPLSNKVFRVMHRFPPSNPMYGFAHPMLARCDSPVFTAVRAHGGCYIANWDGTTAVNCALVDVPVATTRATWGSVKGMYR
jgi:hypothetical protein